MEVGIEKDGEDWRKRKEDGRWRVKCNEANFMNINFH